MNYKRLFISFYLCCVASVFVPSADAQSLTTTTQAYKYASDRLLVKFRRGTSFEARQIAHANAGTQVEKRFSIVEGLELVSLLSATSLHDAVRAYRQQPGVEYVEPDYIVRATAVPNDPKFPLMWNLQNTGQNGGTPGADVNAAAAWNLTTGSSNVVVAILDSGIDYNHQDLSANVWSAAQSFSITTGSETVTCPAGSRGFYPTALFTPCEPLDDNGHGTHVGGIIGAIGNNNLGVVGINWTVQLMPCKFLDLTGAGSDSGAIACLEFVKMMKDSGVNIIATNNSWGGSEYSQALVDAIQAQEQDGILFVAAAGNDFSDNDLVPVYPANVFLPNVISVAATTRTDSVATFSNIGVQTVHMGAPGQEILSTLPGNTYGVDTGTAMAAPHVTGAAALLAAQTPSNDWRAIKNLLLAGGAPKSSLAKTITGRRLDLFGSMTCSGQTVRSRLAPVGDMAAATVGTPINIAVLNISCAQPAGGLQVTVSPGGQTITLVDDGTGVDIAAGDGVYSGQWTPAAFGSYSLTFPGGEVVGIQVLANYSYTTTTFNYRTITGTNLNLGDDAVAQVTSPFPIAFGNGSFTQLMVSSNGTISFTDNYSAFFNQALGGGSPVPVTLVAPFWMDLYPVPNTAQNVFWEVTGTAPNRELVVEWRNVQSFACRNDPSATVTFEVVFSEATSDVLFEYSNVMFGDECAFQDYGWYATIGIQVAPTVATMVSWYEPRLENGSAFLWQIPASSPPSNLVPTITSLSPSSLTFGSPDTDVTVSGTNFVPTSVVQYLGVYDRPTTYVSSTQLQFRILASDMTIFSEPSPPQVQVFNPPPGGGYSNSVTLALTNPAPTITSISPTLMPAGSFGFTLIVNGTGFVWNQSSVNWNGSSLGASVTSGTLLFTIVPASLITSSGTAQITVVNPSPGGGTSNAFSFTVTPATTPFFVTSNGPLNGLYPLQGSGPSHPTRFLGWKYAQIAGADYSKVFSRTRANSISDQPPPTGLVNAFGAINLQNSASLAGLQLHPLLPADFIPTSVATGDFNGDGITDWVVANGGSNNLWVYLGKGDGTSQLPTIIPTGVAPVAVAVADLRHSGKQDIVVAEADSGTVGVFLGNGDGTFGPEKTYYVPGSPVSLAVMDFDGDGVPDIVAGLLPDANSGVLVFLRGDGTGGFGPPIFQPSPFLPPYTAQAVIASDLEKNGLPDIVVVDPQTGVWVLQNAGGGVFKSGAAVFSNAFIGPVSAAVGDVNEDGCQDVVVLDAIGVARVFLGNCDGTFRPQSSQVGEADVGGVAALVDVNGDGHLDLIYAGVALNPLGAFGATGQESGELLGVHFGDGKGNFGVGHSYRGGQTTFSLAVADLNGDGKPDIITANQDSDSATAFLNDGQGGFGVPNGEYIGYIDAKGTGAVNVPISSLYAIDVDGNGSTDLAVIELPSPSTNAYELAVTLNDGTGHFGPAVHSPVIDPTYQITDYILADFRNTGHPDFLAVGYTTSSGGPPFLSYAANVGNGSFSLPITTHPSAAGGLLGVGDFNHDGKLDFVIAGGAGLTTFLGNGDGTFVQGTSISFPASSNGGSTSGVYVGDFNHDGKLDVLVWEGDLYEFLGNGDGTFGAPKLVLSGLGPIEVADVNHDGLPDIIETNNPVSLVAGFYFTPQFNIYLGQPDGSFKLSSTYAPYAGSPLIPPYGLGTAQGSHSASWIGDFNGDGNLDIASFQVRPASTSIYVQFLLGNGDGTFTPTFETYDLGHSMPGTAADFNGDGKTDLVELDGFSSSIHVIPGGPGPVMQVQLVSDPVLGGQGTARVTLAGAPASATTVSLATSDPAITISPTVVIPQGTASQDVPFQIGGNFNATHVFSIQASLGTNNAVAYGTQAVNGQFGFQIGAQYTSLVTVAGQSATLLDQISIGSVAGYATTVTYSCQNLPAGVTCQFGLNPVVLPAGGGALSALSVSTSSNAPLGTFPFTIAATDGIVTDSLPLTLEIDPPPTPDFSLSMSPASQTALPNTTVSFTVNTQSINNFVGQLQLSCSGLPAPAVCTVPSSVAAGSGAQVTVQTQSLSPANYTLTLTGTSGANSRSATAQLSVVDFTATLSAASETIPVGSSANVTITVTGQNGFAYPVTLACNGAPAGVSCAINPNTVTGSGSTTMTISVNSRPATTGLLVAVRLGPRSLGTRLMYWSGASLLALLLIGGGRRRRVLALVVITCVVWLMVSCGGGSSSGSSAPPPQSTTFTLTVQGTADGVTKTINTVTVTVP